MRYATTRPLITHKKARAMANLYVGIDIGKASHAASLLSSDLLRKHHTYERCPTLTFIESRTGFEKLLTALLTYASVEDICVLVERTGHYGKPLEQYLQEQHIAVYEVHVQERPKGSKSDKRDAQALAVLLYNQLERGILVAEKHQQARLLIAPSGSTQLLRGLVQHRSELICERTRRKNKLVAICDELFPELAQIYLNPNNDSALALREKYPTPDAIIAASLEELLATRKHTRPGRDAMARLQQLAKTTIGTKDKSRIQALAMETKQLIAELRLLTEHIEELDTEITKAVEESREGQILTSIHPIGPLQAAMLIAGIGNIANFESAAKLRAYAGWSPRQNQTGTSYDSMTLNRDGNRTLKHAVYLVVINAIRRDTQWKTLYDRLVPVKCTYDERLGRYRGRMKVVGRIAGQMITVIYTLLKRDHDLLIATPVGKEPAAPELYDAAKHHIRRK